MIISCSCSFKSGSFTVPRRIGSTPWSAAGRPAAAVHLFPYLSSAELSPALQVAMMAAERQAFEKESIACGA